MKSPAQTAHQPCHQGKTYSEKNKRSPPIARTKQMLSRHAQCKGGPDPDPEAREKQAHIHNKNMNSYLCKHSATPAASLQNLSPRRPREGRGNQQRRLGRWFSRFL